MLVHRDYELPEPASIETRPGAEIAFSNPGGLTQNLERRIAIDKDGRFKLSESLTDQRNPALCDIFFGISAMERAGTGLIDACQLMTECGGNSAFFHPSRDARFDALVPQPQASAGSRTDARPDVSHGVSLLHPLTTPYLSTKQHR